MDFSMSKNSMLNKSAEAAHSDSNTDKVAAATRNNLYTIEPNISKELLNYIQIYEKYFVFKNICMFLYLSRRQDSNLHPPGSKPDRFRTN